MKDNERDEIISFIAATLIKVEREIKWIKVAAVCVLIIIAIIGVLTISLL